MSYRPKILIVDDNPSLCKSLKVFLSVLDAEILTALSGREAKILLAENDFDLLLLDPILPDRSFSQVLEWIDSRNIDTLVILMSGHSRRDVAARLLEKRVYGFLQKPFELDELLSTVQGALSRRMQYQRRDAGERVTAAIAVSDFSSHGYCILSTLHGKVKRVVMEEFASVRPSGLIAITLDEGDQLGWARLTSGNDEVIFVTEKGQALRFNESKVRSMGRQAAGVQAIRLDECDRVTSMDVVEPEGSLLVITTGGYGKQTPLSAYTPKGRATSGISTIDQHALGEIGRIVAVRVVQKADDLTMTKETWRSCRLPTNMSGSRV